MEIIEINQKNKNRLEEFLISNRASLLQSFNWGEFQEELGRKTWQLAVLEGNKIIASSLVIKYDLPLSRSYLYCSRGPVLLEENQEVFRIILEKIKEIAEKENSIFFRMDPEWENRKLLGNLGFKKNKKEIQPRDTLILDISKTEEEILAQMHSKTRYNIRLSGRKGIKIRISDGNEKDFEAFWKLLEETTSRDKFKSHPKEYYKKQLEFFSKKNLIKLFVAEYDGRVVSAIIVSFYGLNAVYLHGVSSYEYRKYMAPHLVQWEAIKEAKKQGCMFYDFWGIQGKNQGQDWEGITRFKEGFAKKFGKKLSYIGAWDLPLKKSWYGIYNFIKK